MNLKSLLLFLAVIFSSMCFAQLSTRENTVGVFKSGSRPVAGDFGLFVGPSLQEIEDMSNSDQFTWRGIPLVNIKYYYTDNIECRLGLQFSGKSQTMDGELNNSKSADYVENESSSYNRISIGAAYHFSPKNLLDVYSGAYLPLGWDSYHRESTYGNDGLVVSKVSPVIGLGAYIGLQAFVADLPISLGLEYGFSGICHTGKKYKNVETTDGDDQTYYTTSEDNSTLTFSDLKLRDSSFGTDVRFTVSYYFNK
jgi:hypothetical protein